MDTDERLKRLEDLLLYLVSKEIEKSGICDDPTCKYDKCIDARNASKAVRELRASHGVSE